jgi:hypothetical protein
VSARALVRRGRLAYTAVGALLLALAVIVIHARAAGSRRRFEQPAIDAVTRRLPTSDLALSGGSRWLRAPSMEEPTAPFADGPATPDPDPAGAMMAPPPDPARRPR